MVKTFVMVIAGFQVDDKLDRVRFFQELFLLANTNINIVPKMHFFLFSKVDIQFAETEFT